MKMKPFTVKQTSTQQTFQSVLKIFSLISLFQALRVVCQDMFFSRTHNTPSSQAMIGSESTNSRTALEQALGSAKKQDDKMAVVGELVDIKVDGPTRLDFSEQVRDILAKFL